MNNKELNNNNNNNNRYVVVNNNGSIPNGTASTNGSKGVQFKVRFEDKVDSKPVVLPSLTKRGTGALKILHPNHLSRRFGMLENKDADTNGASSASNSNHNSEEAPKNLFGSRLEDMCGTTTTTRRQFDDELSEAEAAEFINDVTFNKIRPVVDRLARKGLLTSNGDLTPEAKVDDNCHVLNPRLGAMIDWADCLNARSASNKYIEHLSNRCKLVSMIYGFMKQHSSLSDKLSVSEKMNSKIAYNNMRLLDSMYSASSASNSSLVKNGAASSASQVVKPGETQTANASIPTPPSSNSQALPQQNSVNTTENNKVTESKSSSENTNSQNNNNKDASLSLSLLDVALDTSKDKELFNMVISSVGEKQMQTDAQQIPPHHPPPMDRNDSEYIDDLAKTIVESAQVIIDISLVTLGEAIKQTSSTTSDKKTLDRLNGRLKWLKTLDADRLSALRLSLIDVFKKSLLKQQKTPNQPSITIMYSSIISRLEMFEMEISEHQIDEPTTDDNNNTASYTTNSQISPTLFYVLNEFKIYLFDILNSWTLASEELSPLRRLLHVDMIAISADSEPDINRPDPRNRNRRKAADSDLKIPTWSNMTSVINSRKRKRHDSWDGESREPQTIRARLSVSDESLVGSKVGNGSLDISAFSSSSYLPIPLTPRFQNSLIGDPSMSFIRLLNRSSSTPMNSVFQFLENNAIPPPTPRLHQQHESDDSDDFVEVAIPKVKFVADKDLNEIKSLLDELVDLVVNI